MRNHIIILNVFAGDIRLSGRMLEPGWKTEYIVSLGLIIRKEISLDEKRQLVNWDIKQGENEISKSFFEYNNYVNVYVGNYKCLYKIEYIYDKRKGLFDRKSTITPLKVINKGALLVGLRKI